MFSAPAAPVLETLGRAFQLHLPFFDGDVHQLVRLVVDRKLAAEDVPAARVVEQLASCIAAAPERDLDWTGDALAATARLLALTSSRLLAQPLDSDNLDDIATDNRITAIDNRSLQELTACLRVTEGNESMAPIGSPASIERRTEPRSPDMLARLWTEMMDRRGRVPAAVRLPAFVRLETAVSSLIRGLRAAGKLSFRRMVQNVSREEAVVHFLAVLELVRRQQATAHQNELFADMTVEYREHSAAASSRAV